MYNIVRTHKTFEDLGTFTLAGGLREIRRIQLAKEELARGSSDKGKRRASSIENDTPSDDKSRMLRSESTNSVDLQYPPAGVVDDIEAQRRSRSGSDVTTTRPLTSPTMPDASMADLQLSGPSEKARGKMRAASEDMTASLERIEAAVVGRNGFVPTQEWVTSWQQG